MPRLKSPTTWLWPSPLSLPFFTSPLPSSLISRSSSFHTLSSVRKPFLAETRRPDCFRASLEMSRHSCCYKQKLRKGLWSPEEDDKLFNHIIKYGHGCWSSVPKLAGKIFNNALHFGHFSFLRILIWNHRDSGLQRCGKSCRLRWINYLRPDLKRGTFSQEEENLIIELHAVLGNRYWIEISLLSSKSCNSLWFMLVLNWV